MIKVHIDVPAEPAVVITTERMKFPLDRVWVTHTDALYLKMWWAPLGYSNVEADLDLRVGGTWRIVQRDPEGNEFGFYGRIDEVVPEKRLVRTFVSEIFPDIHTWVEVDFAQHDDEVVVVTTHHFPGDYERTGYLNLGGSARIREASKRLNHLLKQLGKS